MSEIPDEKKAKRAVRKDAFKVFIRLLPVILLPMLLLSLILLLLARLGVFGSSMRDMLISGGVFGSELSVMIYIILAGVLGITVMSGVIISKLLSHRRTIISDLIDNVRSGSFDIESEKAAPGTEDIEVLDRLREVAKSIDSANEEYKQLTYSQSAVAADRDQLAFNLLAAKASPAMFNKIITRIDQLADEGRTEDVSRLTKLVLTVMDSILNDSMTLVPMASELQLVRNFLDMDEILNGEKIDLRMSIMCSISDYKVLPNVILPIIANFLERARKGTRIGKYEVSLELAANSSHMMMTLRDNGMGMDTDELAEIRRQIAEDDVDLLDDEVTLSNIDHRIKLYYGNDYGVRVSASKLGTVVKLYTPLKSDDQLS